MHIDLYFFNLSSAIKQVLIIVKISTYQKDIKNLS